MQGLSCSVELLLPPQPARSNRPHLINPSFSRAGASTGTARFFPVGWSSAAGVECRGLWREWLPSSIRCIGEVDPPPRHDWPFPPRLRWWFASLKLAEGCNGGRVLRNRDLDCCGGDLMFDSPH